jgi:hypothetical protein
MGCEQGEFESGQAWHQFRRSFYHFRRSAFADQFLTLYIRNWIVSSLSGVRIVVSCWFSSTPKEATIFALSARESRIDENDRIMKKAPEKNNEMLREYDFSQGVRGKYARRYARGSNVVVLEPDVAKVFPNAEAVNSSLRSLAEIIRRRKSLPAK